MSREFPRSSFIRLLYKTILVHECQINFWSRIRARRILFNRDFCEARRGISLHATSAAGLLPALEYIYIRTKCDVAARKTKRYQSACGRDPVWDRSASGYLAGKISPIAVSKSYFELITLPTRETLGAVSAKSPLFYKMSL